MSVYLIVRIAIKNDALTQEDEGAIREILEDVISDNLGKLPWVLAVDVEHLPLSEASIKEQQC